MKDLKDLTKVIPRREPLIVSFFNIEWRTIVIPEINLRELVQI